MGAAILKEGKMREREKRDEHHLALANGQAVPALSPVRMPELQGWIGFNEAKRTRDGKDYGVHFFVDDYQFRRLWEWPQRYLPMMQRFKAVCSPDFSLYRDMPEVVQRYNHWRKHVLAAWWQREGLTVIPTISWSDANSFDWCFEGEPIGGTVAVSSVGTLKDQTGKHLFLEGVSEMMRRLNPCTVLWYGMIPKEVMPDCNIIRVEAFQKGLEGRCRSKEKAV